MANNPVDADRLWFEMHLVNDMIHSVKVFSGKGVGKGKTSLYYTKVGLEEKHEFSEVEDCKRLMSLCDIYLTRGNATTMKKILASCENNKITKCVAEKEKKNIKEKLDIEEKAKNDREFIIETVDNMNIADILIKKLAPLTDVDEEKAMKLRSMNAAMRAIYLVELTAGIRNSKVTSATIIFSEEQFTGVGTTAIIFDKTVKADQAIMRMTSTEGEGATAEGRRKFITTVAKSALISYSLVQYFDPIHKDDPYCAVDMTEIYDARKKAAISAIEFAGGKKCEFVQKFVNTKTGNEKLNKINTEALTREHERNLKLLNTKNRVSSKRPVGDKASNSVKKPKKDTTNGIQAPAAAAAAVEEPDENLEFAGLEEDPVENLIPDEDAEDVIIAEQEVAGHQTANRNFFGRIFHGNNV